MKQNTQGFALIELSIVIIIIGVIIGGIVVGRNMIRSSEIRAAIDESQFYTQALHNFRDKYKELPGDFTAATSIWGAAHATPATCKTTTTDHLLTCNGDGNGWITSQTNSDTHYEQFRAWQHLTLAGMVAYDLVPATGPDGTQNKIVGYNIPPSRLTGAGWGLVGLTVDYILTGGEDIAPYNVNDIPTKHVLILGGNSWNGAPGGDEPNQLPVLTVVEAETIDRKIDDGFSGTGRIVAQINLRTEMCDDGGYQYDLTAEGNICTLLFKTGL